MLSVNIDLETRNLSLFLCFVSSMVLKLPIIFGVSSYVALMEVFCRHLLRSFHMIEFFHGVLFSVFLLPSWNEVQITTVVFFLYMHKCVSLLEMERVQSLFDVSQFTNRGHLEQNYKSIDDNLDNFRDKNLETSMTIKIQKCNKKMVFIESKHMIRMKNWQKRSSSCNFIDDAIHERFYDIADDYGWQGISRWKRYIWRSMHSTKKKKKHKWKSV